jgi:hypothetical protein
MYTTLNILKASEACVPGFTRMASFFGINTEVKEQRIPLHVVALVGGKDDALWTLNHGAVIDPEEFKQFYARHLPAVWKHILYNELGRRSKTDRTKNKYLNRLLKDAYDANTFEEIEAYLVRARSHRFSHTLFDSVIDHDVWRNPHSFIAHVIDIIRNAYPYGDPCGFPEDDFKPKDGKDPYNKVEKSVSSRSSRYDDEDEGDGDVDRSDDEEERPVRLSQPRRDPDDIPDEEWIQKDRPTILIKYRGEFSEWLKKYPHSDGSGSSRGNLYFVRTTRKEHTLNEDVAAALCSGPDMYSFMTELKYKHPKGVKVIAATENKPASMQCTFTEPKQMFTMVRMLTAKSAMQDEERGEW